MEGTMNKKGFTLMEVVIAVALLGLVSIVSVSIVTSLLRSAVKSQAALDIEQTTNFVALKLKFDLEKAYDVTASGTNNNTLTILQGSSSAPVTVVYKVSAGDACDGTFDGLFVTDVTCLTRQQDGGAVVLLTNALSEDPSKPSVTRPNKSAVFVLQNGVGGYFSEIPDKAVNISLKFVKPLVAGTQTDTRNLNFAAESVLDTTIVLRNL